MFDQPHIVAFCNGNLNVFTRRFADEQPYLYTRTPHPAAAVTLGAVRWRSVPVDP